jgi:hypothetical protein
MTLGTLITFFTSYYLFKLTVLFIGIRFIWNTKGNDDPGFRLVWYGVGLFLLGETFCGVNIYITQRLVLSLEILHGVGMAAGFSVFFYGLWRILDSHVVHFTDDSRSCMLLRACTECDREEGGCQYQRLFGWFLLALALIALVPLFSPLKELRYAISEFNLQDLVSFSWIPDFVPFPGGTEFVHPVILDVLHKRVYPLIAAVSFTTSYLMLRFAGQGRDRITMAFAGLGLGTLSYSALKVILYSTIDELAYSALWEELTELLFIVLVVMTYRLFSQPKVSLKT